MRVLRLVLEAPMAGFPGVTIDAATESMRHPGLSMLAGLLANALGHDVGDPLATQNLQDRLRIASAAVRTGKPFVDFQTARTSHKDLLWSTRGAPEGRKGHATKTHAAGPVNRRRGYLSDLRTLVALTLDPAPSGPDVDALAEALDAPARPLSIGPKCCPPARPPLIDVVDAEGLLVALRGLYAGAAHARWPADEPAAGTQTRDFTVADHLDWRQRAHKGARTVREGFVQGTARCT